LGGRDEEENPLGRPRRRRENNIKMNFREMGWGYMGRIYLPPDRDRMQTLVNAAVKNLRVP
jgi:hypothetical protein